MDNEQKGWNQFKAEKLDRKKFARRMRRVEVATQRHAHRFIVRRIDNIRLVAREITTWLVAVGLIIGGIGLQLLWGQDRYVTATGQSGGVYVEGAQGEIKSVNPLFVSTNAEASVARLVFSSLYSYDTTGTLSQDAATGMTVDATQRVYTVALRDDIKWHDGQKLTAKDVVFTINLIKNPAVHSPLRVNWLDVSVSAVNNTTVQFTLPAVYAAFPHALTFPILPEHLLASIAPSTVRESSFSAEPIGSGPFMFRRLQEADIVSRQRVVHLQANDEYYKGAPKIGRFELHAYPEEADLVNAMNAGELSGASDISVAAAKDIKTKRANTVPLLVDSGVYLIINIQSPLLRDTAVRRALQQATDVVAIQKELGGGVRSLAGPLLANQLTGTDVAQAPATDVSTASRLLDAVGWKLSGSNRVKDGKKLELTITTTKKKEYEIVLAMLKEQWQKIGVTVNTNLVDTASTGASSFDQNVLQSKNFDILLYELTIGADPDVYAYWYSSSRYNFSGYANTFADTSLVSARSRLEPELRNAKYKQFVKQWFDDAPAIALYQPAIEYVTLEDVEAVKPGISLVSNADRYANVQYWTVSRDNVYKTP